MATSRLAQLRWTVASIDIGAPAFVRIGFERGESLEVFVCGAFGETLLS
jgi:hypothetical protein